MPLIAFLGNVKHDTVWCQQIVFSSRVTRFKHGSNTVKTRWKHVFHTPMCSIVALAALKVLLPPPHSSAAARGGCFTLHKQRLRQHRPQHHSIVGCGTQQVGWANTKQTRNTVWWRRKTRTRTRTGFSKPCPISNRLMPASVRHSRKGIATNTR
jgi:hypothetical protein